MPIDPSIPLQGKRPDTMGRLSSLIDMQRSATALKSEKQTLKQRQGLAEFDVQKIVGDDGTIDLNKIPGSGLREAAGDQFPDVLGKYAAIKQQQIAAKHGLVGLANDQRAAFGEMMGALRSDPDVAQDTQQGRQKTAQAFAQYAEMFPDAQAVLKAYASPIINAPPGKLGQVIQNIQLQATSASDQATRQGPQYTGTGSELRQTNPYAQQGQAPQSIPLTIAPGQQDQQASDQLGNLFIQRRDARGNIVGYEQAPGTARFGVGERQSFEQQAEANFQNVSSNRIAAQLAPQQLDQIDKALQISKATSTGGGSDFARRRASIESAISALVPGIDAATDDATRLQMLDKYLERIAADSARVLGANATTDAARESIARQNASTGYTGEAIRSVLEYAKAQTMAMSAKGDAQESWLKKEGNGITKQHEFETAWRQSYDPRLFQLESMDDDKRAEYVKKLPADERKKLSEKLRLMRELGAMK